MKIKNEMLSSYEMTLIQNFNKDLYNLMYTDKFSYFEGQSILCIDFNEVKHDVKFTKLLIREINIFTINNNNNRLDFKDIQTGKKGIMGDFELFYKGNKIAVLEYPKQNNQENQ